MPEAVGFALAQGLGFGTPHRIELAAPGEARLADLSGFAGDRLVIKAMGAGIAHKSDLGLVITCDKSRAALEQSARSLEKRGTTELEGFSVHEYIHHDRSLGGELLLGVHWTDDFGPVAVLGFGGLDVERLAGEGALAPVLVSAAARDRGTELLPRDHPLIGFLTRPFRGRAPRFEFEVLENAVHTIVEFSERTMSPGARESTGIRRVTDFEINPMVMSGGRLTALDVLIRTTESQFASRAPRPLEKLGRLLAPASIAIAGVSTRRNIGRVILDNVLNQGFPKDRLWVVKPGMADGSSRIGGCRCFSDFASLPEPVDLAVLSVGAAELPDLVDEVLDGHRARSLILISGGLGERAGSEAAAGRVDAAIRRARKTPGGGPLVNGGNCLGVRSVPGAYDTLFIPGYKLNFPSKVPDPLALLSQSGAFAVARVSKLESLNPRYLVTFGNQIDLTLSDYLAHFENDPEVRILACYIEGFKSLDGRRFLEAVRKIDRRGGAVILYRAARTRDGAVAAASHTASMAGSYRATAELAHRAGALVAGTIEEFEDLVRAFTLLDSRRPAGRRLGAVSNAGFECVTIADNLLDLELAQLSASTAERVTEILRTHGIDEIVASQNPLDVTPVLDDDALVEATRALLEDPGVDVGLMGCVPLTGALETLPAGEGHGEDLSAPTSIVARLADLWQHSTKPWVIVVDGGDLYDPFARALTEAGIPTFRSADRALRALARWAKFQLLRGAEALQTPEE